MLRRFAAFLLALALGMLPALAEEPSGLPALRECTTLEAAEAFLLFPPEDGVCGVVPGYIRYIAQDQDSDAAFRAAYWQGGEPGSVLDLTLERSSNGRVYNFYAGTMCTRAAYSMALSYLGVDVTPGSMSAMIGRRDIDPPYTAVSEMVGVERVAPSSHVFDTMVENYLSDPSYSPVYVYLRKPNGQDHALLVIGKLPEKSRYIVLDPGDRWLRGEQYRVYMMAFNKTRQKVVNSTFRNTYNDSEVLALYQWRLIPPEDAGQP